MRQKQNSLPRRIPTQTQPKFALLFSPTSSHCVKLQLTPLNMMREFWTHTGRWWGCDGSGGRRKACGERLAPTLREEMECQGEKNRCAPGKVMKFKNNNLVQQNHSYLSFITTHWMLEEWLNQAK
ncbi:hypothetical protein ATANTOWER_004908 [Ataeniobius toweri]|uniref:Uncharacterized protein n=1 Tax=Ataeniobius toweri TaxID=208326 RepID=A0ABU7BWT4_9TELE|nr:hypothetical protein [Ataeniobius toweri]